MVRFGSVRAETGPIAQCCSMAQGLSVCPSRDETCIGKLRVFTCAQWTPFHGWMDFSMYVCMYMIYDDYFLLHLLLILSLSLSLSTRDHLFHSSTYQVTLLSFLLFLHSFLLTQLLFDLLLYPAQIVGLKLVFFFHVFF